MKKLFLLYVLIFSFTRTVAQNILETKQVTINSDIYETTRSFRLALPVGMPSDTKYNLIFVLDANYIFDIVIGHSYTASYLLYYLTSHNSKFSSYILFALESTATTPFPADFQTGKADNQLIVRILTGEKV